MKCDIWSCEKRPLTEVLSFIVDNRGKTVPTTDEGHILIATNCVRNESLYPSYEKVRYLSDETYSTWFRAHPQPGDILFVCKGTPGKVCMVPDPIDFCIAQDMVALRVDPKIIYNRYLLVVLRSFSMQQQIEQTSVGDVIPHFKKSFFDQLLIPIPEMEVQRIIGDYYFAFANKIEINKKINNNLEQQAQTLVKNYCETNPPKKSLGSIMTFANGFAFQSSSYLPIGTYKIITIKNVQDGQIETQSVAYINDVPPRMKSECFLHIGDVLLSLTGNVGRVGIVCEENLLLNQRVAKFVPAEPSLLPYLYFYFRLPESKSSLETIAKGTAQQNLSPVETLKLKIPYDETAKELSKSLLPMFQGIIVNQEQNHRLAILRDTLLPRLMSGELDVSDIDL